VRQVGWPSSAKRTEPKFGYRSKSKVETFKNHVTFWQYTRTYCLNMAISNKISHNVATFGVILFFKNSLCICCIGPFFSVLPGWENSPNTETPRPPFTLVWKPKFYFDIGQMSSQHVPNSPSLDLICFAISSTLQSLYIKLKGGS
jgi:hypothetical protein